MNRPPRILVIEHERDVDLGLFGERLAGAGAELSIVGPEAGSRVPSDATGYDGAVVLGGTMGPTDDERAPWLPGVRDLIVDCLVRGTPLLGLCLGAQLIAHAAGGRVAPVPRGPELGVTSVTLTDAGRFDPLFGGLPPTTRAVQWHWLEVEELPPGAVALLTNGHSLVQAFRVGPLAWGTQFHPEALIDTVRRWATSDADSVAGLGLTVEGLVQEAVVAEPELRSTWGPIADRWLHVCRSVTDRRRSDSALQTTKAP